MTPEKIFEIAHRYSDKAYPTPDDPPSFKMAYWEFREKDLIAFTKAIIEAERESSDGPVAWISNSGDLRLCEINGYDPLYRHPPHARKLTPVAWLKHNGLRFNGDIEPAEGEPELPLYRHSPPARKLTDEEIQFMWGAHYRSELEDHYLQFARAVERRINGEAE